jgi:hypothetical protein
MTSNSADDSMAKNLIILNFFVSEILPYRLSFSPAGGL